MEVFQTILMLVICSFYTTSAKSVAGFKSYSGKGNLSTSISDANTRRMAKDEALGNELFQRTLNSAFMKVRTLLAGRHRRHILDFLYKRHLGKRFPVRNDVPFANPGAIRVRRIGGTIDLFLVEPHALRYIAPSNMVRLDGSLQQGPSYGRGKTDEEQNSVDMSREQGASNMYEHCCAVGVRNACCPSPNNRRKINVNVFSRGCCIGSNYKLCCPGTRRYMNSMASAYENTPKQRIDYDLTHRSPPGDIVRKLLQESTAQTANELEAYQGMWRVIGRHPTVYSDAESRLSRKGFSNGFEERTLAGVPDHKYTNYNHSSATYDTSNNKENLTPIRNDYVPYQRSAFDGSAGIAADPVNGIVAVAGWPTVSNPIGKSHFHHANKFYCDKLYRQTVGPTKSNPQGARRNSIHRNAFRSYLMGDPTQRIFPYNPNYSHIDSRGNGLNDKLRNLAASRSHEGYVKCLNSITSHIPDKGNQMEYTVYPVYHTTSTSRQLAKPCLLPFGCKNNNNVLTSSVFDRPVKPYISRTPYLYRNVPLRSPLLRQRLSFGSSKSQGNVKVIQVSNTKQIAKQPNSKSKKVKKNRDHIKGIRHHHHHKPKHIRIKRKNRNMKVKYIDRKKSKDIRIKLKNRNMKVKYIDRKKSKDIRRKKTKKPNGSKKRKNVKAFHVNKTRTDGERDLMQENAGRNKDSVQRNPKDLLKEDDKRKNYVHNDDKRKKKRVQNKKDSSSGRHRRKYYIIVHGKKMKVLLRNTKRSRKKKK